MVILVDTNIIIDALANREPYADDAKRIMEKSKSNSPRRVVERVRKKLIIRREYRTITSVVVFSVLLKAVNL